MLKNKGLVFLLLLALLIRLPTFLFRGMPGADELGFFSEATGLGGFFFSRSMSLTRSPTFGRWVSVLEFLTIESSSLAEPTFRSPIGNLSVMSLPVIG